MNYDKLPEWARDGMRLYIEARIPPGDGLRAALENKLVEYVGRTYDNAAESIEQHGISARLLLATLGRDGAPDEHRARYCRELIGLCGWLYNDAPSGAWGSPEIVAAWLAQRKAMEET